MPRRARRRPERRRRRSRRFRVVASARPPLASSSAFAAALASSAAATDARADFPRPHAFGSSAPGAAIAGSPTGCTTTTRSSAAATRLSPSTSVPGGSPARLSTYTGTTRVPSRTTGPSRDTVPPVARGLGIPLCLPNASSADASSPRCVNPDARRSALRRNSSRSVSESRYSRVKARTRRGSRVASPKPAVVTARLARSTAAARCSCSCKLCVLDAAARL